MPTFIMLTERANADVPSFAIPTDGRIERD